MTVKILVTGGLGYIGSHTVVELIQQGYQPIIIDSLANTSEKVADGIHEICGVKIPIYIQDIRNSTLLNKVFKDHPDIQAVIHFAADKAVGESVEKPLKYYDNNIGGLICLLEEMRKNNVHNLVFSSSCTVYGEPNKIPVDEETPIAKAASPYGNTKIIAEDIIQDVANAGSLKAVNLRYFNPVGAHDSALIGELPLGVPNNLVPFITQTAAGLRNELTVFGDDYQTADGTCIRDYIHVVDLAKAHVKTLEYLQSTTDKVTSFNIGTGTGSSVLEVIKAFEKINNVKLNYKIGQRRAGDVEQIWANTEKASKVLGWNAERDLENMMETAWKWQCYLQERSS